MGDGRPSPRKRRPGPVAHALMLALLGSARGERAGAGRPEAAGPAARRAADALCARRGRRPRMRAQLPGMAFGRGPDRAGAAIEFAQALESLGGRRLPILIHSPGGSVADAMAMGELIRAKGLAVAVARTLITNCPERAPRCPSGPGRAMTGGAMCASACVLVLAGGVERLVGPAARVGVHQITTVVKETEGSAHLTSTRKIYEQAGVDEAVTHYLTAMGVGDPVMALMRKTPAASIRWLSLADLRASGLATTGARRRRADRDQRRQRLERAGVRRRRAEFVQASARQAVRRTGRSARYRVPLSPRRRRGRGRGDPARFRAAAGRRSAGCGLEPDPERARGRTAAIDAAGTAPARAIIPRERFCALASGGSLSSSRAEASRRTRRRREPQAAVDIAAMDGAKALIAEACP